LLRNNLLTDFIDLDRFGLASTTSRRFRVRLRPDFVTNMTNMTNMTNTSVYPLEYAVIQLTAQSATATEPATASGIAVAALPRAQRLPFRHVVVMATHLEVTGADGVVEALGSAEDPLSADARDELLGPDGLVFVEVDENTGLAIGHAVIRG
jgi:hypothetical protein